VRGTGGADRPDGRAGGLRRPGRADPRDGGPRPGAGARAGSDSAEPAARPGVAAARASPLLALLRRLRGGSRSRGAGAALLALLAGCALLGPWLHGIDPARQDLANLLAAPSWAEPLGTDHLGRSQLARILHAMRLSLGLALLSVLSAALPGAALGLLAAWGGGGGAPARRPGGAAVMALPGLLLVLLLATFAPGAFWPLYLGLSLTLWVEYFRVVRAAAAPILAGPQVEAAGLLGFGAGHVVRRHLLPELLPLLRTLMTFGAATAVLALAALGFVGTGVTPPTAELGVMMVQLLPYYDEAPWLVAAPVAVLFLLLLGLALAAGTEEAR
jgi:peptide/nickel transport system permease protein